MHTHVQGGRSGLLNSDIAFKNKSAACAEKSVVNNKQLKYLKVNNFSLAYLSITSFLKIWTLFSPADLNVTVLMNC